MCEESVTVPLPILSAGYKPDGSICDCGCHMTGGGLHIIACCSPTPPGAEPAPAEQPVRALIVDVSPAVESLRRVQAAGDLMRMVQDAQARFDALSPVDQALHLAAQRRSMMLGLSGSDSPTPPPSAIDMLGEEVRRLRAVVADERIIADAIQHCGCTTSLPPPARLHTILHAVHVAMGKGEHGRQGFLTSRGRFVDRQEGWAIAEARGQLIGKPPVPGTLFSEDLW